MEKTKKILIITGSVLSFAAFLWFFIYLGNKYFPREEVLTINEAEVVAENWVRNFSSSYPFYGKNLSLKEKKEIARGEYEFLFFFLTDNPNFGMQENRIRVCTKNAEVVEAVTNEIFDEIEKNYIEKEETVKLYFVLQKEGEDTLSPVERKITISPIESIEKVTLEKLLEGPSKEELEMGYKTQIEETARVLSFRKEEDVAYVEFNVDLQNEEIAFKQAEKTLTQFEDLSFLEFPEKKDFSTLKIVGVPEEFSFEEDLEEGVRKEDVKYLQIILNADPDTLVTQDGPGSLGEETEVFTPETTEAVKIFQRKYASEILEPAGLILSTGKVDTYTRDKLNAILEESRWHEDEE